MRTVVITGIEGFIGKNLVEHLKRLEDIEILGFDIQDGLPELESGLARADFLFHLAGVNRPRYEAEFMEGNARFTEEVLRILTQHNRNIPVLLTSSTQAALDNAYGVSKRQGEEAMFAWARETGGTALVYRLPNVFGKWCRPNYNSAVATFCHQIAHDQPIQINDPNHRLTLVYIDDVISAFLQALNGKATISDDGYCYVARTFSATVQELADTIGSFRTSRETLVMTNFADEFTRCLYATYVSYLPTDSFGYGVKMLHDNRGWLAEIIKSKQFGQIFVSRTKPGITRGNHWHHTKAEKFIVIQGQAVIRFRQIHGDQVIEVPVSGDELTVVDIPTGYTHSITNTGDMDVITLFWANEIFDPEKADTMFLEV